MTNNKKYHSDALQQIASLQSRIIQLESHAHELTKSHRQLDLIVKSTGLGTWDWYVQTRQVEFCERRVEVRQGERVFEAFHAPRVKAFEPLQVVAR